MSETINLSKLQDIIDNEGLEYAVTSYTSGEEIEDPDIREAWINAREAFKNLNKVLEEKGIEESW